MKWIELRLARGADPQVLYDWLDARPEDAPRERSRHHFYFEPWWPEGAVVRLAYDDVPWLTFLNDRERHGIASVVAWDDSQDAALYGDYWERIAAFFEAGSCVPRGNDVMLEKLVHCFLNAQGLDVKGERRFARRFWWGRRILEPVMRWREWRARWTISSN